MALVVDGVVSDGKIILIDGPALEEGRRVRLTIELAADPDVIEPATPIENPGLRAELDRIRASRKPLPTSPTHPSSGGLLADDPTWDEHLREVLAARKASTDREAID